MSTIPSPPPEAGANVAPAAPPDESAPTADGASSSATVPGRGRDVGVKLKSLGRKGLDGWLVIKLPFALEIRFFRLLIRMALGLQIHPYASPRRSPEGRRRLAISLKVWNSCPGGHRGIKPVTPSWPSIETRLFIGRLYPHAYDGFFCDGWGARPAGASWPSRRSGGRNRSLLATSMRRRREL